MINKDSSIDQVVYESPNHHKLFDIALVSKIYQLQTFSVLTQGYMESHIYFDQYQNEIRELFSIDKKSQEYLQKTYPFLFDSSRILIAIHIRTGNSIVEIDEGYYTKAIAFIAEKFPTAEYVLFTNDRKNEIVQRLLETLTIVHIIHEREDYLELWAFSKTSHAICCFSTFSWWGSYLISNPNKQIIVPQSSIDYMKKMYKIEEDKIRTEYYTPGTQVL